MPVLTVMAEDQEQVLTVAMGANLRRSLLAGGISPYTALTQRANCGGRGLCATCGVWLEKGTAQPVHWHDKLAAGFGYPRLSCQITVTDDMIIRLVEDKWLWGSRDTRRAVWFTRPAAP